MTAFDKARWDALSPYLDQVLDLAEEQRPSWLASLAQRDRGLAADLTALLEEQATLARERFLEGHAGAVPNGLDLTGQRIDAYTLLTPVGAGGMGSVWLAERNDGRFDRQVAVKFLNIALAGRGEERFTREGRILARLTHPNIAHLVDAGITGGRPYLVIEFVDGEPIDRYCDRLGLGVMDRLTLFLDVLGAVAHAHASLIVHRDLKPSNVFVDRQGRVKLLDFGIATLLDDDEHAAAASTMTLEHGMAMTPEYAAPEQITAGAVTTATDVYALGVLLYLLLTGQHPAGESRRSTADLVKAITEIEPRKLSDVAPERVRRALKGDLDTIVGKALKKNPNDRYASAAMFADDLRRSLRHDPISARRDALAYRGAKFVRRNRVWVAAAALTFGGLAIGLYAANRERLMAERRFEQLRQLSNKVFDLDRKIRNLPGSTQARQSLVAASVEYLDGLAAQSKGDPQLTEDLAAGYLRVGSVQGVPTEANLGDVAGAAKSLEKADTLNETLLTSSRRHAALSRSALIAEARMILAESGRRRAEAVVQARRAEDRLETFLREQQPTPAERDEAGIRFSNIALAYVNMHAYEDSARNGTRCVEFLRPLPKARSRIGCLSILANALRYQGDLHGALQAIEQALQADASLDSSDQNYAFNRYGLLLRQGLILGEDDGVSLERPKEAMAALQQAVDMNEANSSRDPNDATSRGRVATAGRNLADILRHEDAGRALAVYDLAIRRVGEIRDNLKARRDEARVLANSSYALRALGRAQEAGQRIDRALTILTQTKDYPANRIAPDGEVYDVLLAQVAQLSEEVSPRRATEVGEQLLAGVTNATPDPLADLRDAPKLSRLYATLEGLYRRTGDAARAADLEARRRDLWQHWNSRLPNNPFVLKQLASLSSFPRRFRSSL